jgi:hypothetical protein
LIGCINLDIICDDHDETTIDYCDKIGGCLYRPRNEGPIEGLLDYDY